MEKSWNFVKLFDETTSSQKSSCQTHKLVCLTASFLATGGFKFESFQNACMVYKHAYLNILLLLHSAFSSHENMKISFSLRPNKKIPVLYFMLVFFFGSSL